MKLTPLLVEQVDRSEYAQFRVFDFIRRTLTEYNTYGISPYELDYDLALKAMQKLQHLQGTRGAVHDIKYMQQNEEELRPIFFNQSMEWALPEELL